MISLPFALAAFALSVKAVNVASVNPGAPSMKEYHDRIQMDVGGRAWRSSVQNCMLWWNKIARLVQMLSVEGDRHHFSCSSSVS